MSCHQINHDNGTLSSPSTLCPSFCILCLYHVHTSVRKFRFSDLSFSIDLCMHVKNYLIWNFNLGFQTCKSYLKLIRDYISKIKINFEAFILLYQMRNKNFLNVSKWLNRGKMSRFQDPNEEICITELLKVLNLQENVRCDDWNQ